MESNRAPDPKDQSGIALFMVIAAMTVLSVLVTEFTYTTQVNHRMAYDSLDQIKAHYLAKSGFKLSLLRLKAYSTLKGLAGGDKGGGSNPLAGVGSMIPKAMLEKIWNFPFIYPFPANLPGMSMTDKDAITAFEKTSGLEGRFTAVIESESGKYNLNSILANFAAPSPSPSPSPNPRGATPPPPPATPGAQPNPGPSFDPQAARDALKDYIANIFDSKFRDDPDVAGEYRDLRLEDLTNNIVAWADRSYTRPQEPSHERIKPKKAPFYSVSELHMITGVDDTVYGWLAPAFTSTTTPGINPNTLKEDTLRALVPGMTKEEVDDFFKFRDSQDEDHLFKDEQGFFDYLQKNIGVFKSGDFNKFKDDLAKRGVRFVFDEEAFKITVQAQVNQSTRVFEAWVQLVKPKPQQQNPANPGVPAVPGLPQTPGGPIQGTTGQTDPNAPPSLGRSGLKVTFMRIL